MAALLGAVIPNVVQMGEAAPTIDVWGSGFVSGTTLIQVDGTSYPTAFIDATHLRTVGVDPSLRTQPGYVKITVIGDTTVRYFHFTPPAIHLPNAANPTKSPWYDVTP